MSIKWRVENVTVERTGPTELPVVEASIRGYVDSSRDVNPYSLAGLGRMIEGKLNLEPQVNKNLYGYSAFSTNSFDTREEAENALDEAKYVVETYGHISIYEFADICGASCSPRLKGMGYSDRDIRDAKIGLFGEGKYTIYLPRKPRYIYDERESYMHKNHTVGRYAIKNVIFNEPATIVFWADGTKTVVKCQDGDVFDPEKGLAMAFMKKVMGNKGHYFETVKKWVPEEYYEEPVKEKQTVIGKVARVEVTPDGVNAYVDLNGSTDARKLVDALKNVEVKASMEMVCEKEKPENPCDGCERAWHTTNARGENIACYQTCAVLEDYLKSIKEDK